MTIDVINSPNQELDIHVNPLQEIGVKQDGISTPLYEGKYDVTPKVTEQTLPTAQKLLEKDVHIKEIPYFEVLNNSGGNTVYIGKEV